MDIVEQLRTLAREAAIRSIPKLLKNAAGEGIKATKQQAEDALKERVPAQVLAPGPTQRAQGKAFSESPESRYTIDLIDFSQNHVLATASVQFLTSPLNPLLVWVLSQLTDAHTDYVVTSSAVT